MTVASVSRRKRDTKRGIKFSIMLCGESGTGKTTFVNTLLEQNIMPHKYTKSSVELPKTLTFNNINGTDIADFERVFRPHYVHHEPGISITETNVEIIDEDDDSKLLLSVIDTPGFGDNLDNDICFKEISQYLEQQFDIVLAEETRVKRNPRFEDPRIHALLYFITPTGHGLRELDVEAMKQLSKYCNIIPIIGRADSFTEVELKNFKKNVLFDIEKFNIPIFEFSYDEEEDDEETVEENKFLASLQPFAVITSEQVVENDKGEQIRVRTYPWGVIDINDAKNSDFPFLKNVLLGSHLQELKELTHDYLYETYRTEKLSQFSGLSPEVDFKNHAQFTGPSTLTTTTTNTTRQSSTVRGGAGATAMTAAEREPPSLSNLAEIIGVNNNATPSTPKSGKKLRSMLLDDDDEDEDDASISTPITHKYGGGATADDASTIRSSRSHYAGGAAPAPISKDSMPSTPKTSTSAIPRSPSLAYSPDPNFTPDKAQLRKISETIPYLIDQRNQILKQKKLEEKEEKTVKLFASRAAELERKAAELKAKQRQLEEMLKKKQLEKESSSEPTNSNSIGIKKEETLTDLHSIVSGNN